VPGGVVRILHKRTSAATVRMLGQSLDLARISGRFEDAGLSLVSFKDPVLAWSYYDAPGLREGSDIYLPVRPQDLDRAAALLLALGCTPAGGAGDRRFFSGPGQFNSYPAGPPSIFIGTWSPHTSRTRLIWTHSSRGSRTWQWREPVSQRRRPPTSCCSFACSAPTLTLSRFVENQAAD